MANISQTLQLWKNEARLIWVKAAFLEIMQISAKLLFWRYSCGPGVQKLKSKIIAKIESQNGIFKLSLIEPKTFDCSDING